MATINTRIDSEVATINSRLETLEAKVEKLESEVESIKTSIASMQSDIAEMQQQIAALLARIQSVTYVPKYSDGKATMDYGTKEAELDFMISPKNAVTELAKLWNSALGVKAIYTQTRAVDFIDLPITGFGADSENGVISLTVSGVNLNENFYVEQQDASLVLQITDGNSNISSEYVPMTPNFNIQFEDMLVKDICCEHWDSNVDGELSYAEAAAVKEGQLFRFSYTDIRRFPEFRYFTAVINLGNDFYGRENLLKIVLPESLSTIGEKAFFGCSSLREIIIPDNVSTMGSSVFSQCSKLERVNLPKGITVVGGSWFSACDSLKYVTIPENVIRIEEKAFSNCKKLTAIYCKAKTPPAIYWEHRMYGSLPQPSNFNAKIYVPRESYSSYMQYTSPKGGTESQENWYLYKDHIEPYDFE